MKRGKEEVENGIRQVWGGAGFADDAPAMGNGEKEVTEAKDGRVTMRKWGTIFKKMAGKAGLGFAGERDGLIRARAGEQDAEEAKCPGAWIPDAEKATAERVARARKQMAWIARKWRGREELV